jgi:hypothetical protein
MREERGTEEVTPEHRFDKGTTVGKEEQDEQPRPKPSANQLPTGNNTMVDTVLATTGTERFVPMTVDATIGDMWVWPLIDTGAGVSLVHAATVERLQLGGVRCVVRQKWNARILGVSGDELVILGTT